MLSLFLAPSSAPFAIALAVVAGLFILEILTSLIGGTVLGLGGEGPDLDIDVDTDFDLSTDLDVEVDIDALDADAVVSATGPSAILGWVGARDVPFLIWMVSFLTMFGLAGLILQSTADAVLGTTINVGLAVIIAIVPALAITRIIANWVSLLMPKTETSAMRTRSLGGHRGTITQGTAVRGKPAEAKVKDRHGNMHYLRVEPLEDDAVFAQGSDVTLIRKRGDKFFVI